MLVLWKDKITAWLSSKLYSTQLFNKQLSVLIAGSYQIKNLFKNLSSLNSHHFYKNLFRLRWKNLGSYTRVFTVLHLLQGDLPREEKNEERRIKPHLSLILQEYVPDSLGGSCQESGTAGIFFTVDLSFNLFRHFFTNVSCAYNNYNETTQHLSVYCYYTSLANHSKPRHSNQPIKSHEGHEKSGKSRITNSRLLELYLCL